MPRAWQRTYLGSSRQFQLPGRKSLDFLLFHRSRATGHHSRQLARPLKQGQRRWSRLRPHFHGHRLQLRGGSGSQRQYPAGRRVSRSYTGTPDSLRTGQAERAYTPESVRTLSKYRMTTSWGPHFSVLVDLSEIISGFFLARPPRHMGCPGTDKSMVNDCHITSGPYLPSIFAWCEALHPCGDSSVNNILLGLVCRICKKLDKRQDGVYSL